MKKRLWWSMLFSSAALLVTSVTMFAQRPTVAIYNDPVGRAPSSTSTLTPRIPATYSGQAGATDFVAWEGFNSTNYLNRVQLQFSPNFADIAVGPTDILTIVNRRIARWRNPKAKGAAAITSTFEPPTNEALLDSWLGTAVLNQLCPTLPRSTFSCLIDSATIRYDQMHGRFVVLMTVIDTGIQTFGFSPTQPRRANWVLAVSKYATFITGGTGAPQNIQTPAQTGDSSDLFLSPTPPVGNTAGTAGWNSAHWNFYVGGTAAVEPGGNINTATDIATVNNAPASSLVTGGPFNCGVLAQNTTTSVCYFPTSARLGFDNDNVIITSSVFNSNANLLTPQTAANSFAGTRVRVFKKSYLYAKMAAQTNVATPAPVPGAFLLPDYLADYYDLYAFSYVPGRTPNVLGPLTVDAFTGPALFSPYTLAPPRTDTTGALVATHCEPQHLRGRPAASFSNALVYGNSNASSPIFTPGLVGSQSTTYIACIQSVERFGPGLTPLPAVNNIFVQAIISTMPGNPQLANTQPNTFGLPYTITLAPAYNATAAGISAQLLSLANPPNPAPAAATIFGGIAGTNLPTTQAQTSFFTPIAGVLTPTVNLNGQTGSMKAAITAPFWNPTTIPQLLPRDGSTTQPNTPNLFVGDDRPQKIVFREGHLYETHVAYSDNDLTVGPAGVTNSTVQYTILQALGGQQPYPVVPTSASITKVVLRAQWWNTYAWAPMYDVPANVSLSNQVSPINQLPWLEKLFVATTLPPLSPTDPRIQAQASDPGTTNGALNSAYCAYGGPGGPSYDPSQPIPVTGLAYAGLYDMRCGTDTYDTAQAYRDPVQGSLQIPGAPGGAAAYSISTRNGAAIDPHDGSLWNYGIYATRRFTSIIGPGQWSTYVSNYNMSFPATDPYGNSSYDYSDVPAAASIYPYIKIAQNVGLINPPAGGAIYSATVNYPNNAMTVMPSFVATGGGSQGGVNTQVTRAEMAKYVMTSLMDEQAISQFLNATGGCANSFADVAPPSGCTNNLIPISGLVGINTPSANNVVPPAAPYTDITKTAAGVAPFANGANVGALYLNGAAYGTASGGWRYIEAMYRRGITKGCAATGDARREFCPGATLTRGQMAVFLIRAKMSNVFTTSLNGCPTLNVPSCAGGQAGDNFTLFVAGPAAGTNGYFSDVATTDEFYLYVQKMFEMRISDGTALPTLKADNTIAAQGTFGTNQNITRGEVLVFVVRAFFL
jgi:hypothetical protein